MSNVVNIRDTFRNFLAGFGVVGRDKTMSQQAVLDPLSPQQLEAMYRGDWISRKVVDIPAFDACRAWRAWQADKDQIDAIEKAERKHNLRLKMLRAMTRARLYGGAAVIIGLKGQKFDEPLNVDVVKKGDLAFVHVVERWQISAGGLIRDITSPWYGEPSFYRRDNSVTISELAMPLEQSSLGYKPGASIIIHPSRVVRLLGNEYPDTDQAPDAWSDSILQTVNDTVRSASLVNSSVSAMISEAKLDVIKVPGLTNSMSTNEGTSKLISRFANANVAKSTINALLLDETESWERMTLNMSGMEKVMMMYLMIACGAADIPATRMLNKSPDGQNSTGDSDSRNYYDKLSADQELRVTPALSPLDQVLLRDAGIDPSLTYKWSSLWQMTDSEKADLHYKKAQGFKIDVDAGLVDQTALRTGRENQLIEDGVYPGFDLAIAELGDNRPDVDEVDPNDLPPDDPNADVPPTETVADSAAKPLMISRPLLNVAALKAWAKKQGFKSILDDLHVTILYSKTPVDWMKMGSDRLRITVDEGPPRVVEVLGEGAVVLSFASSSITWRHNELIDAGGSHDYLSYQPHVTISYNANEFDIENIEPYLGPLIFGPEEFSNIDPTGMKAFEPKETMLAVK